MVKRPPASTEELLQDWYRRARENQFAHYEAIKPLSSGNYKLGIPVALLSGLVGTSIFATLQAETAIGFRIAVGIISVLAAVLASLQTFLRLSERAEKHRAVAVRYGALRRELETAIAKGGPYEEKLVDGLREKVDSISSEAPEIPDRVWKKVETLLKTRT
jgi:hypothetical protein